MLLYQDVIESRAVWVPASEISQKSTHRFFNLSCLRFVVHNQQREKYLPNKIKTSFFLIRLQCHQLFTTYFNYSPRNLTANFFLHHAPPPSAFRLFFSSFTRSVSRLLGQPAERIRSSPGRRTSLGQRDLFGESRVAWRDEKVANEMVRCRKTGISDAFFILNHRSSPATFHS